MSQDVLQCPECDARLRPARLPEPGQRVRCPKCGTTFAAEARHEAIRRDDDRDHEDERPRARSASRRDDRDEEEDYRPRRRRKKSGGGLLWLWVGIGGVVLVGLVVVLILVLRSVGGGATKSKLVGRWEHVGTGLSVAQILEFTEDGKFRLGGRSPLDGKESIMEFGSYKVSGKKATIKIGERSHLSINSQRITEIEVELVGDDEIRVKYLSYDEKYRKVK